MPDLAIHYHRYNVSSEMLKAACIAMGSSFHLIEDYYFRSRFGSADVYWTPDHAIKQAARSRYVRALIWC